MSFRVERSTFSTPPKWLTGFDDDFDGAYSLREFMLIPHVNLLASWHAAQDIDQNGMLSPGEFRVMPPPALAAISALQTLGVWFY